MPDHANAASSDQDVTNGSMLGPLGPPEGSSPRDDTTSTPQSPYTANRAAIRNLTLPTIPNFEIPLSPPGSPPPGMDKKFEHFLELKRQGVHFNEKLAQSSALRNPGLLEKLMRFAGVNEEDQYNTTLPEGLWNPKGFPTWAYKEELAKSQQEMNRRKEDERSRTQRDGVDFVSAANSKELTGDGAPATAVSAGAPKASTAERVMAGLDRTTSSPGSYRTVGKDLERRGPRSSNQQPSMSSRSPKRRKRSRSR